MGESAETVNAKAITSVTTEDQAAELDRLRRELDAEREARLAAEKRAELTNDFIENGSIGLHWVGPDGTILWVNKTELDLLGYVREEYVGRNITEFHADQDVIGDILCRLSRNETLLNYEARLRCKNGDMKTVLINSNVLWCDGKFIHTRCFTRDISEIKRQALAMRESEEALRRSNMELEQFAFVAAHDLQEPLRTISLYTEILLRKLATPDPQLQGYGERVISAAQRMRTLLTDLLTYSRVVHQPDSVAARADLNAVLAQAQQDLADAITRSGARITSEQLPVVRGDIGQLAVVLQNLLGNALKYQASGSRPEVSVSVRQAGGRWIVSVKDNGIGFPPEHAERIFGLFKRLHGDRYPGTGLGLAICRRIVERDGGRLWAESAGEGSGATFFIELQAVEGG